MKSLTWDLQAYWRQALEREDGEALPLGYLQADETAREVAQAVWLELFERLYDHNNGAA